MQTSVPHGFESLIAEVWNIYSSVIVYPAKKKWQEE